MDTQTIKQVAMAVKQSPSHQAVPKVPVSMQTSNKATVIKCNMTNSDYYIKMCIYLL